MKRSQKTDVLMVTSLLRIGFSGAFLAVFLEGVAFNDFFNRLL